MTDLALLTAREQARLIRARKASAVEIIEAALERIRELNPRLTAFLTVTETEALAAARKADEAVDKGLSLGPLHGVPVAFKDNYQTKGIRTTAGSRVLEHFVPDRDATVVRRFKQAGAITIGKTNLTEFATGVPAIFAELRNPWDLARLAGMSSGGSAAAVAAFLCPIAMGHDSGGSVRIPASYCGVVGLMATYGRVSRHGIIPGGWSRDHPGPLTHTVEDAALVLSVIAGYDAQDPTSTGRRPPPFPGALRKGIAGLRLGVPKGGFASRAEGEIVRAVEQGIRVLESLGGSVREVAIPAAREIGPIAPAEMAFHHDDMLARTPEKYGPALLERLRAGQRVTAVVYLKAQQRRRAYRQEYLQAIEDVDVIVTPTMPTAAPLLRQKEYVINGKSVGLSRSLSEFTVEYNMAWLPAISVPCGFTAGGLPIGLQIAGKPFDEATILRCAHAYERNTEWHKHRPPLSE